MIASPSNTSFTLLPPEDWNTSSKQHNASDPSLNSPPRGVTRNDPSTKQVPSLDLAGVRSPVRVDEEYRESEGAASAPYVRLGGLSETQRRLYNGRFEAVAHVQSTVDRLCSLGGSARKRGLVAVGKRDPPLLEKDEGEDGEETGTRGYSSSK